jgi:excisionase family DNA binding protein
MQDHLNSTSAAGGAPDGIQNPGINNLAKHPQLLRVAAVARLLDCSERHVYELNARGKLPNVLGLGRSLRFRPADVLNLINGEVA